VWDSKVRLSPLVPERRSSVRLVIRSPHRALPITGGKGGLSPRQRAVVVAVIPVRVVQVPIMQVVDMITVRHGLVAARWAMCVSRLVTRAAMRRSALHRICAAHVNDVLIHVIAVWMVQMPIMQIVDMITVTDSGMPAGWTVLMRVPSVCRVGTCRHDASP
jgi:hypothetical protein